MFGWSSPAFDKLEDYAGFPISLSEFSWIASILNVGCLISSSASGAVMNAVGRKKAMLGMAIPFTLAWVLIMYAQNFFMLFAGRFLIGVGGAVFLTCPQYTSEIAIKEIRGTLGTFTQLLFVFGILYGYTMGSYIESLFWFNFSCAILPFVFFVIFMFMPETPYYFARKNKYEEALAALEWLRGHNYDCKKELSEIREEIESQQDSEVSLKQAFGRRSTVRGIMIAFGLIAAVQFSGINAVLFYTAVIFRDANVGLSADLSTIIIGLVQAFATLGASMIVDKAGRKILLLISSVVMSICLVMLGVFYFLKDIEESYVESLSWLPLTSLSVYTIAFSIGK